MEWLPSSGYEYADLSDIEFYPAGDPTDPNYAIEIWLPVVPARH
ncbi:GyrI-like domain-containing protein [uncultured Sphaerochaeta sp.]